MRWGRFRFFLSFEEDEGFEKVATWEPSRLLRLGGASEISEWEGIPVERAVEALDMSEPPNEYIIGDGEAEPVLETGA